eukprot:CAMPEP_0194445324 /NCGR_PEP_ID=MMETSP0176-20130528/127795_1 /TAXON_ID=216777 /ORGANISM="Proboscia alata, Strain PI-D3" /LENGTH=305 /DNA_ID=CAMNT_0039271861 /DNA_START=511 /DNA_END=1425 /DNA_ORIENTATION=+
MQMRSKSLRSVMSLEGVKKPFRLNLPRLNSMSKPQQKQHDELNDDCGESESGGAVQDKISRLTAFLSHLQQQQRDSQLRRQTEKAGRQVTEETTQIDDDFLSKPEKSFVVVESPISDEAKKKDQNMSSIEHINNDSIGVFINNQEDSDLRYKQQCTLTEQHALRVEELETEVEMWKELALKYERLLHEKKESGGQTKKRSSSVRQSHHGRHGKILLDFSNRDVANDTYDKSWLDDNDDNYKKPLGGQTKKRSSSVRQSHHGRHGKILLDFSNRDEANDTYDGSWLDDNDDEVGRELNVESSCSQD